MFFKRNHDEKEETSRGWISPLRRFQKVFVISLLLAGLSINAAFAKEGEKLGLLTIYHIYSDGEYVGTLSDKEKLEQLKNEKLQEAVSEFENLSLTVGDNLSVIPERVFTARTTDDATIDKLQEQIAVEAEAIGIVVDGELALYVKDMDTYNKVLHELKLQSVTEEELNEFEARTESTESLPPLKENETRIMSISFTGEVEAKEGTTNPEEVRDVKEALTLLNKGTLEEKTYEVQQGDVLGKIAVAHNMKTATLLQLNPEINENTLIRPGDLLNVTVLEPAVEVEVVYEAKKVQPIAHKSKTKEDSKLLKGEKKVIQKGSDGEKEVTEVIQKRNGQVVGRTIADEKILVEPTDKITVVGTKVIPSRGTGRFAWPTVGGYVSSTMGARWGRVHQGIDIARPSNRSILASDNGVVTKVGYHGTYGNRIVVSHRNGYETLYAHLSSTNVRVGQTVSQGQKIGVMGSTGRSTGVHLHFEVMKNGSNINPLSVLR